MIRNKPQMILALCLTTLLVFAPAGASALAVKSTSMPATQSAATVKEKVEVVYANLTVEGDARTVHVVNRFDIAAKGTVTDHGAYESVVNLTDTGVLAQQGDTVRFEAPASNFYYQGNTKSTDLPWKFNIAYGLDGKALTPQQVAGQSGKLTIDIDSTKNEQANAVFHDSYMLQITLTLDSETCTDIDAPGATIASAGSNTVLAYTVLPGKDADISLGATVRDFEMVGIDIAAMPFSMDVELPDTDELIDDFTKLTDAIGELNDGVVDLKDGIGELKDGTDGLQTGSTNIRKGLADLKSNSSSLLQASQQIKGALAEIAASLEGGLSEEIKIDDLVQLPQALSQLSQGLTGISGGLTELRNGFASAYGALDEAMEAIPNGTLTQEQIAAIYSITDPSQHTALDQLVAVYSGAMKAKGTYEHVKGAFAAIEPTVEKLNGSIGEVATGLSMMSTQLNEALSTMDIGQQLEQLTAGMAELSGNYGAFHQGLAKYMGGVGDLATEYPQFDSGIQQLGDGVVELYDGVKDMQDGTRQLHDETADLPETVQAEIDRMLAEYTVYDFTPVSFTSANNQNVSLVQFVLKCDGIEKPEQPEKPIHSETTTFWDRFKALFTS